MLKERRSMPDAADCAADKARPERGGHCCPTCIISVELVLRAACMGVASTSTPILVLTRRELGCGIAAERTWIALVQLIMRRGNSSGDTSSTTGPTDGSRCVSTS
eukprot:scaffold2700_cov123-Isochrysis_galbana.AAC.2